MPLSRQTSIFQKNSVINFHAKEGSSFPEAIEGNTRNKK